MSTRRNPGWRRLWGFIFTLSTLLYRPTDSGAVVLNSGNVDQVLAENEFVFINFYADWCRFSNLLAPEWDKTAEKAQEEFQGLGKVVVGKIDCDKETLMCKGRAHGGDDKTPGGGNLGTRFHITKYPTLKYVRNGIVAKREYRGKRDVDAFIQFIKDQTTDHITEYSDLSELTNLDGKKRHLIGYFEKKESPEFENFRRIASNLKDDCVFHAGFGGVASRMHPPGQSIVAFRPNKATSNEEDETFTGNLHNYDEINIWASDKCTPLVREITFENAEELTEEGLPFLILFHLPDDNESVKRFTDVVQRELLDDKQNVNFLIADGQKFAHPLHHLGKSKDDLPLIAIDSFRHMYLFPNYSDMEIPGKLKQFLKDLYSGKLHREFHYGPDKEEEKSSSDAPSTSPEAVQNEVDTGGRDRRESNKPKDPPPSQFQHLGPSRNRYTLLHDEF